MATRLSEDERARLQTALADVCHAAGIDPAGATLVRYTMNAVYRIEHAGVVVRMAARADAAKRTARVAAVAAAFERLGLPTARLAPGIPQPVHANGWSATIWTLLPQPAGHRFAPMDLASPLKVLHAVREPPRSLPEWDPLHKARLRLTQIAEADQRRVAFTEHWAANSVGISLTALIERLGQWCDELTTRLDGVDWTLQHGLVHGDAHAGNLLFGLDGHVVLCDLDSVCVGPPEWDLIPAAHGVLRFGDDPRAYAAFVEAYGFDVTTCPSWDTLRQIRDLQVVTGVIGNLPGRPDVADALAHRLQTIMSGDTSPTWRRFR